MIKEERPYWLRGQENGVLAEARTRAFLLERFWILERSVDIEGADFIIQRRLTSRSLLDRVPPRLGFVQSKYYADENSTQYVHREYVVDADGAAHSEFFLMCHSGKENAAKASLLTSQEIIDNFRVADDSHSKAGCFILSGKEVLSQRFLVLDQHTLLDRVEQTLKNADFFRNRSFLSWALPTISTSEVPIKEEFLEPIDNWWGDIPKGFVKMRELARRGRYDLEEVLDMLRSIENSDDPEFALGIAEELDASYGNSVRIPDRLFDEDFFNVVRYHKIRYGQLYKSGLVNAHAALRRTIIDFVITDLSPRMPLDRNQVYVIRTKYDPTTFLNVIIDSRQSLASELWSDPQPSWHDKDVPNCRGILKANQGCIETFVLPGRYGYQLFKNGEFIDNPAPWAEKLTDSAEMVAHITTERILELQFGEIQP